MRIDVLTLFPEMFEVLSHSIMGRARQAGLYSLELHNIRAFSTDRHNRVDDSPYGGGFGMVMACQPIMDGIAAVKEVNPGPVIFLGPRGKTFDQAKARELSQLDGFTLLCGHYEGIDERIYSVIDEEISIGDFILTGGEMAALPLIDAVVRLIPGALGSHESTFEESFTEGSLEYPHYTKPADFRGMKVPAVLLSGHHEKIRQWRRFMSLELTRQRRPDLYHKLTLTREDHKIIRKVTEEMSRETAQEQARTEAEARAKDQSQAQISAQPVEPAMGPNDPAMEASPENQTMDQAPDQTVDPAADERRAPADDTGIDTGN